jgi:hypothetical protein
MSLFNAHSGNAEAWYTKYIAAQKVIERVEREALAKWGSAKLAAVALKDDLDYRNLCTDRNRYQAIAHMEATMALLYK